MTVNTPPAVFNVDDVIAATGADPIALQIGAPTDADGDALTITLGTLPSYGTVEYFDGAAWVTANVNDVLSSDELMSLRYTPPASGDFSGETITYSVDDGTDTTNGAIAINVRLQGEYRHI